MTHLKNLQPSRTGKACPKQSQKSSILALTANKKPEYANSVLAKSSARIQPLNLPAIKPQLRGFFMPIICACYNAFYGKPEKINVAFLPVPVTGVELKSHYLLKFGLITYIYFNLDRVKPSITGELNMLNRRNRAPRSCTGASIQSTDKSNYLSFLYKLFIDSRFIGTYKTMRCLQIDLLPFSGKNKKSNVKIKKINLSDNTYSFHAFNTGGMYA